MRKASPHTSHPAAAFAPAIWFCNVPHKTLQSMCCLMPGSDQSCTWTHWKQPVARIICLGMCSLAQAAEVAILLAAPAPLTAIEEDEGGFSWYWPYNHHQKGHSCNCFSSMVSQFVHFKCFEKDGWDGKLLFFFFFPQQKHVSAFLEHILFEIKNCATFHNLPRHTNYDKKSQLKVFYKSFCGWAVLTL